MDRQVPQLSCSGGDGGRRHQRRASLVASDIGVALADIGSDVTIESADLVLVGDDLRKLAEAVACGRRVLRTIRQNLIAFAIIFNLASVAAASSGWISPVTAAVVHQISSLAVVLNSLRLLVNFHAWQSGSVIGGTASTGSDGGSPAPPRRSPASPIWLSGLHTIGVGEIGAVQQFGKRVLPFEEPGLHYRLPYPFAWHYVLRPSETHRVEIGFRSVPGEPPEPPAYEWNVQHRGGRYLAVPEESYVWTGDENLIDVNLVVHYRVVDPEAALFKRGSCRGGIGRQMG